MLTNETGRKQHERLGGIELIAIKNAKIHPVDGPVIEKGTVLIDSGKIVKVGARVSVPAGAR